MDSGRPELDSPERWGETRAGGALTKVRFPGMYFRFRFPDERPQPRQRQFLRPDRRGQQARRQPAARTARQQRRADRHPGSPRRQPGDRRRRQRDLPADRPARRHPAAGAGLRHRRVRARRPGPDRGAHRSDQRPGHGRFAGAEQCQSVDHQAQSGRQQAECGADHRGLRPTGCLHQPAQRRHRQRHSHARRRAAAAGRSECPQGELGLLGLDARPLRFGERGRACSPRTLRARAQCSGPQRCRLANLAAATSLSSRRPAAGRIGPMADPKRQGMSAHQRPAGRTATSEQLSLFLMQALLYEQQEMLRLWAEAGLAELG